MWLHVAPSPAPFASPRTAAATPQRVGAGGASGGPNLLTSNSWSGAPSDDDAVKALATALVELALAAEVAREVGSAVTAPLARVAPPAPSHPVEQPAGEGGRSERRYYW